MADEMYHTVFSLFTTRWAQVFQIAFKMLNKAST